MKMKSTILAIITAMLLLNIIALPVQSCDQDKHIPSDTHILGPVLPTSEKMPITIIPAPPSITDEDIKLLALLTMAEAEGESEKGQRLVIDTVLNRMDSPRFPSSVRDVIYQPNQYSGMQPPRIDCCYVKDELLKLVYEELASRSNGDVIFFRTERYSQCGVPLFQVGNHYFSGC